MPAVFDFEKPVTELETKIEELKAFAAEKGLNLENEISTLEKKAAELKQSIYGNLTPWQKVLIARHAERPTTLDYISNLCEEFIELHGDRCFGEDQAIVGGIGRMNGYVVTVLGHQKGRGTKENLARNFGMAHPEGYRKAERLMRQAEKFGRPVVCLVDTPGAYCGIGAEERGEAEAIAKNIMVMSALRTPIIVVVIGEGGSGGALALGVGDRILMLEHAVFSVSSPETCASILWKDAARAREAAEVLKLTAQDLKALGVIDEIIPEPLGGAHRDVPGAVALIREAIFRQLDQTLRTPLDALVEQRYQRIRSLGYV